MLFSIIHVLIATVSLMSEDLSLIVTLLGLFQSARHILKFLFFFLVGGEGHANMADLVEVHFHMDEQESILRLHICLFMKLRSPHTSICPSVGRQIVRSRPFSQAAH